MSLDQAAFEPMDLTIKCSYGHFHLLGKCCNLDAGIFSQVIDDGQIFFCEHIHVIIDTSGNFFVLNVINPFD